MNRTTNKHLESIVSCINAKLLTNNRVGRYDVQYCYGHTNVVFYSDPSSTGCADVRCGLTKSEAMDVLQGIWHALSVAL